MLWGSVWSTEACDDEEAPFIHQLWHPPHCCSSCVGNISGSVCPTLPFRCGLRGVVAKVIWGKRGSTFIEPAVTGTYLELSYLTDTRLGGVIVLTVGCWLCVLVCRWPLTIHAAPTHCCRPLVRTWCFEMTYLTPLLPVAVWPHPLPVAAWSCPLPVTAWSRLLPVAAWSRPLPVATLFRHLPVVTWPRRPHVALAPPTPSYPTRAWCRVMSSFLQLHHLLQLLRSLAEVSRHSLVRSISICNHRENIVNVGFAQCGCRWRTHHYSTQSFLNGGLTVKSLLHTLCLSPGPLRLLFNFNFAFILKMNHHWPPWVVCCHFQWLICHVSMNAMRIHLLWPLL